jgi:membrane fusion protein (multidrug efflux system)
MKKYIIFSIIGLVVLIGVLGGIKGLQINRMITRGEQYVPPPETVTAAVVKPATWPSVLTAVGSLEAVQGVMVTAELTGKVVKIAFEPGSRVKAGDLLVQQDTTSEEKPSFVRRKASMELARLNLQRARELLPENVITQSNFDSADAEYKQAAAQVDAIRATIAKKTIRAPFGGKLGIRLVNLGQILEGGQPIVSLQAVDPIFVNFSLPQDQVTRLQLGLPVRVATDALAGEVVEGRITAINPQVDAATRNLRIQATLDNPMNGFDPACSSTGRGASARTRTGAGRFPPRRFCMPLQRFGICRGIQATQNRINRTPVRCASNSFSWVRNRVILSL